MKEILIQWFILIFQVIVIGLVLGYIKKLSCNILARGGKYKVRGLSSFIGTPIHEFGHYIMAKIFGFRVYDVQFFPTRLKNNGNGTVTLGYVKWSTTKRRITNSFGMLLVGIAPFISGSLVIILLTYLMEPSIISSVKEMVLDLSTDTSFLDYFINICTILVKSLAQQNIFSITFIIYLLLISMIAIHMTLSSADIKTSGMGLIQVTIIVILLSLVGFLNKYIRYILNILTLITSGILALCFICQLLYLTIAFIRCNIIKI